MSTIAEIAAAYEKATNEYLAIANQITKNLNL
jgi:hypothetical protein